MCQRSGHQVQADVKSEIMSARQQLSATASAARRQRKCPTTNQPRKIFIFSNPKALLFVRHSICSSTNTISPHTNLFPYYSKKKRPFSIFPLSFIEKSKRIHTLNAFKSSTTHASNASFPIATVTLGTRSANRGNDPPGNKFHCL